MYANPPLIPKNSNGILRALTLGRVSTVHQNESNIEAGYDYARRHLKSIYSGPLEVKEIGARESGMLVDRATIREAEHELESGTWDVLLMEDCSKSYRNPRWLMAFVQDYVDLGVRVIAPGDNLDTAEENWELMLNAAAFRHGMHIPDTRRRIRRTATHTFAGGGMVQKVKYGYRKLTKEEARAGTFGPVGLRIAAVPEATAVINEIADRLIRGDAPAAIAEWLNDEGVSRGPYVKSTWTPRLILGLLKDPILVGVRHFRRYVHHPVFETGKHRRELNREGPLTAQHPELAHLSQEKFEAVQDAIARRVRGAPRLNTSDHPRRHVPRSRSTFPHQHARCSACGNLMYAYADGQMKCGTLREASCWNHVQVDCQLARERIIPWIVAELSARPQFRKTVVDAAWDEYRRQHQLQGRQSDSLAGQRRDIDKEIRNVVGAIALSGGSDALLVKLRELEQRRGELDEELASQSESAEHAQSFQSRAEMDEQLESAILGLAEYSFDLADLLRRILVRFDIVPVRRFDQDFIRPRARLTLQTPSADDGAAPEEASADIDLFDPPVEVRFMPACRDLKARRPEMTLREIGRELNISYMTVKRALQIAGAMRKQERSELYVEVTAAPETASRWRRRTA